jgi:hypothetical protein
VFAPPPNLADFTTFLNNTLPVLPNGGGVVLPSQDARETALCEALETVNDMIACVAPRQHVEAVYNLAADRAVYLAADATGQTYFADLRRQFRTSAVSVGVVSAASNQATSMGQTNPKTLQELTLAELQYLKSPYGRRYLEIAQAYGSDLWGVS